MRHFKAKPKLVFTVHGEGANLAAYAQAIRQQMGWNVMEPQYLETVALFSGI
jgi:predicted metal-dependent RNase